jgi:hypothetical protein
LTKLYTSVHFTRFCAVRVIIEPSEYESNTTSHPVNQPGGLPVVGGIVLKILQKWQCHRCEKGWLVIQEDAHEREVGCPFCLQRDEAEAVAEQNPDIDYHGEMGCLWPGYNEFDKIAYMVSKGRVTQDQAREYINARFRGEKPSLEQK